MAKYIVKTENGFEAKEYNEKPPLNYVLVVPENNAINTNNFLLVESDVTVSWNNYYGTSNWRMVQVYYKSNLLFERNGVQNIQVVIDILNKFKNISNEELNEILQDAQEKEKSALELEIEELKTEKVQLEEQMKIYKTIQTKNEEIKELLAKLD